MQKAHPLRGCSRLCVQGNRQQVLACGPDGLAVYDTLKRMRFLQVGSGGSLGTCVCLRLVGHLGTQACGCVCVAPGGVLTDPCTAQRQPSRSLSCPAPQPGQPTADELAQQAAALYQAVPPAQLARQRGIQLEHSAAIDAYLRCTSRGLTDCGWLGSMCGSADVGV